MPKFKTGDLVELLQSSVPKCVTLARLLGAVGEVIEGPFEAEIPVTRQPVGHAYKVKFGEDVRVAPECDLKLIPPKREIDKVVSWDNMPWQPKEIRDKEIQEWEPIDFPTHR